jgi:hypothetical protein
MNVEAIVFANRALVVGGLLSVEGAGWEHYDVPFFPTTVAGYVAGILTLDEEAHGSLPELLLEVHSDSDLVEPSRASMIAVDTRPGTVQGVPYRIAFAIPFMTTAKGPALVNARLTAGDDELAMIAFAVRGGAPDAPPADL